MAAHPNLSRLKYRFKQNDSSALVLQSKAKGENDYRSYQVFLRPEEMEIFRRCAMNEADEEVRNTLLDVLEYGFAGGFEDWGS